MVEKNRDGGKRDEKNAGKPQQATASGKPGEDENVTPDERGVVDAMDAAATGADIDPDIAGWLNLEPESFVYKPESCEGVPLRGYIAGVKFNIPHPQFPFDALVFRTTAPSQGFNGKKELAKIPAGAEVIVPVGSQSRLRKLFEYAKLEHLIAEVRILPLRKTRTAKGNNLWLYDVRANPVLAKRSEVDAMGMDAAIQYALTQDRMAEAALLGAGGGGDVSVSQLSE